MSGRVALSSEFCVEFCSEYLLECYATLDVPCFPIKVTYSTWSYLTHRIGHEIGTEKVLQFDYAIFVGTQNFSASEVVTIWKFMNKIINISSSSVIKLRSWGMNKIITAVVTYMPTITILA